MLVSEFGETYRLYTDFQVWEIKSMTDFFDGSNILSTIFNDMYGFYVEELEDRRSEIEDSNLEIMAKLLKTVGDKSFFIFTLHDENHLELVKMQKLKIMNFGVDIEQIKQDCVYVIIMDKKKHAG